MSVSSPLKLYHFQAFLIWWHSPFKYNTFFRDFLISPGPTGLYRIVNILHTSEIITNISGQLQLRVKFLKGNIVSNNTFFKGAVSTDNICLKAVALFGAYCGHPTLDFNHFLQYPRLFTGSWSP